MAYDKTHTKNYKQLNIKLDIERDKDVIDFFEYTPNKRKALCAVVREWIESIPEKE